MKAKPMIGFDSTYLEPSRFLDEIIIFLCVYLHFYFQPNQHVEFQPRGFVWLVGWLGWFETGGDRTIYFDDNDFDMGYV